MKPDEALWMVIYMARAALARPTAWKRCSLRRDFWCAAGPSGRAQQEGTYELMVLRSEAVEAQRFLSTTTFRKGFTYEENRRFDLRRRRARA